MSILVMTMIGYKYRKINSTSIRLSTELPDHVLNWPFSPKLYNRSFKILSTLLYIEIKGNGPGQKLCIDFFFTFIPLIQPHMFNFSTNLKISPGFDWFSPPLPTQFGSSSQVVTTATFLLVCFYLDIFISVDYSTQH